MLDPKEEKRFEELRGMCRELKVPAPPEIMIGMQVHDKDGILTFDDIQRGHSWTRNFWNLIFSQATQSTGTSATYGAGYLSGKDTGGGITGSTSYGAGCTGWVFTSDGNGLKAAVGGDSGGIVVGTGDTAFGVDQYALVTIIANGATAGLFSYQVSPNPTKSYNAPAKTWTASISRIFNNNSGGSITVKETGLYWKALNTGYYPGMFGGSNGSYMMERSVLSPTVAVANGAQLTVTYEISMDFSAID